MAKKKTPKRNTPSKEILVAIIGGVCLVLATVLAAVLPKIIEYTIPIYFTQTVEAKQTLASLDTQSVATINSNSLRIFKI